MPTIKRGKQIVFISRADLDKALADGSAVKIRNMPIYQEVKAPAKPEPAPEPQKVKPRAKRKAKIPGSS